MEYKEIAKGVKIPVLGIGTWQMGGGMGSNTSNDKQDILAIKTAIDLGMTHIDTAEIYANGKAEELVAKAIQGLDRKKLFITTKVKAENLKHDDVLKAVKASLKRLQTDYLDLYLIHWPNSSIPLKESMKAMNALVENGTTKFIGVSNFTVEEMKEAQQHSENKVITNQVEYNLLNRNRGTWANLPVESEVLPYCQENDMLLTAYSPVDRGTLTRPGIPLLDELAQKYKKTQAQISINWLISKKNVITIPKTSNLDHLKDNLGAVGWKMSKEDIEKLDNMKT